MTQMDNTTTPDDASWGGASRREDDGADATISQEAAKMTNTHEDMAKRVAQYIQMRDHIEAEEAAHIEKMKPLRDMQEKLGGILHRFMGDNNIQNLKTSAGTCYISTRYMATVQDADAFMRFVVDNEEFDLLERRAHATAVKEYVKKHDTLPAGVSLNALSSVGVRRPAGKPLR